jgi:hypothetical protein
MRLNRLAFVVIPKLSSPDSGLLFSAIRAKEKTLLQRAAFLQTMSSAFTPLVAVYAAVCTFLGHILSGNELSVEQVFILTICLYNKILHALFCFSLQSKSNMVRLFILARQINKFCEVVQLECEMNSCRQFYFLCGCGWSSDQKFSAIVFNIYSNSRLLQGSKFTGGFRKCD